MLRQDDFLGRLALALQELGLSSSDELEVVTGGSSVYEIDGAGTKWAPVKGTRKYNKDAFIVIRRPKKVIPSQANEITRTTDT
tara:strand:- start:209 stop:457 length:249 start_codon:yes stop_codon:yes gene_type:complete